MRVLVTGGSGFVGGAVAVALADRGHSVVLPLRDPNRIKATRKEWEVLSLPPLEAMSVEDWLPQLTGIDAVVHCAAIAHIGPSISQDSYAAINRDAAHRLALAAKQSGVQRFVFVSSIRAQVGPVSAMVQTEQSPAQPTEAYGKSKLEAESLIRQAFEAAVILRPSLVVGPDARGNLDMMIRLANTPLPLPFGAFDKPQALVSLEGLVAAILLGVERSVLDGQTYVVADDPHPDLASMLTWLRAGLGRSRNLVTVPEKLLALPFHLIGKSDAFNRISGGLSVDASRLRQAGWQSPITPQQAFFNLGKAAGGRRS